MGIVSGNCGNLTGGVRARALAAAFSAMVLAGLLSCQIPVTSPSAQITYYGSVNTEFYAVGTICIGLAASADLAKASTSTKWAASQTLAVNGNTVVFSFNAPTGKYLLFAFNDDNLNGKYDKGEAVGYLTGAPKLTSFSKASDALDLTITIPAPTPSVPSAPTIDQRSYDSLRISWSPVPYAQDYQLFADASPSGSFSTQIYEGTDATFTQSGLSENTSYYYKVVAQTVFGASSPSAAAKGSTSNLTSDLSFDAVPVDTQSIQLSWNAIPAAGGYGYEVDMDTNPNGSFSNAVFRNVSTSTSVGSLIANTLYYFKITVFTVDGPVPDSDVVQAMTYSAMLTAPTLTATPTGTTVGLTWPVVANATNYQVFRDTSAAGSFATKVFDGAATSYSDSGLSKGTAYYYEAKALAASGNYGPSALSSAVSATTIPATAGAPVLSAGLNEIDVSWTATAGASTYDLQRDTTSSFAAPTVVYSGATPGFNDTGLGPGARYYYRVRAGNAAGSGAYSTGADATTQVAAVTGMAILITGHYATITWTQSPGATAYKIWRSYSSSPDFSNLSLDTLAGTTGAVGTFTDPASLTLNSPDNYCYWVQAVGPDGFTTESTGAYVNSIPITQPAFTSVTDGAGGSAQITLNWSASLGSFSSPTYELQYDTSASFTNPHEINDSQGTSFTAGPSNGLTSGTIYYFRVQATNSYVTAKSDWSASSSAAAP